MTIADLLRTSKSIAVVGLSPKRLRPSFGVSQYMQQHGYRIIPVNPTLPPDAQILGEPVHAALEDIQEPIDIVDVFRESSAVPEIVEAAIRVKAKAIWLQEGVAHEDAERRAAEAGLFVVSDRCILKEHHKLN